MSRTLPLVFVYWVVIALSLKKLYMWASPEMIEEGVKRGQISPAQLETIEHAIHWKQPMLNPGAFYLGEPVVFCHLGDFIRGT